LAWFKYCGKPININDLDALKSNYEMNKSILIECVVECIRNGVEQTNVNKEDMANALLQFFVEYQWKNNPGNASNIHFILSTPRRERA
jgi:uncharacterized membrane protein YvbJ